VTGSLVAHLDNQLKNTMQALQEMAKQRDELLKALQDLATYVDAYPYARPWAGRPHKEMDAARTAILNATKGSNALPR
jgi:hypothetical protein